MRFLWLVRSALVVTALTLSSCSAQYHLRRAVAKNPSIAKDTIVKIDTAIVTQEKVLADTIVVSDTIVQEIISEDVRIRVQRIHDTIRIEATCLSDTIEITKEVEVVRYVQEQKRSIFDEMTMLIRSLIALVVCFALIIIMRKISKY